MIEAKKFCDELRRRGFSFFTGVPCSVFKSTINHISTRSDLTYVTAANEGGALAIAAGAWLAGRKPVVILQISGVGNLINPLSSLSLAYDIPALLLISARAYPDGTGDEPQHRIMGRSLSKILDALGVYHLDLPTDAAGLSRALDEADAVITEKKQVAALIVSDNCVGGNPDHGPRGEAYPLKRIDAIRIVSEALRGPEVVVSTTAMISRELFWTCDRKGNFYMQGSMGHALGIGLGIALNQPNRRVVVLDGDGAIIMHMGALSTVGYYGPRNLLHVVVDNEAYESTGNQDTTSRTTHLEEVARGCGYRTARRCVSEHELREALSRALRQDGPTFILVKVNRSPTAGAPRITSRYSPSETALGVEQFLLST